LEQHDKIEKKRRNTGWMMPTKMCTVRHQNVSEHLQTHLGQEIGQSGKKEAGSSACNKELLLI
jgi:hypothetical protein